MTDPTLPDAPPLDGATPADPGGVDVPTQVRLFDPIVFLRPEHLVASDWQEHVPFAFWLVARQRPRTVVDLGGADGVSFLAFCQAVAQLGLPATCTAAGAGEGSGWQRDAANAYPFSSLLPGAPAEAASQRPDGSVDLLNLRSTDADDLPGLLAAWLPKLSPRGVLLLHGTAAALPDAALDESHPRFGFDHGGGLLVVGVGADQSADLLELFGADEAGRSLARDAFARLGRACAADTLETEVNTLTGDLERALAALADRDRRVQLLGRDLRGAGEDLRIQRRKLSDATRAAARQERAAARARKQAEAAKRELRNLRRSLSWRLTSPLRVGTRLVRRGAAVLRGVAGRRPAAAGGTAAVTPAAAGTQIRASYPIWDEAAASQVSTRLATLHDAHRHEVGRCLVSVILPIHNQAADLAAVIDTVRAQSHENFELLLADAGSTDDAAAVVAGYHDSRIRHLSLAGQSVAEARNAGLIEARGEIVCHLDVHHRWQPEHLRNLVTFLLGTGATAAYSGVEVATEAVLSYQGARFDYEACRAGNYLDLASLGHRRLDHATHRFDPDLGALSEWDYLLTVTRVAGASYLPYLGARRLARPDAGSIDEAGQDSDALLATIAKRHVPRTGHPVPADPGWEEALAGADRFVGDDHSLPFEQADATLDWQSLRQRPRVRGLVSVIVLAYNNYELTHDCVESVLANPGSHELELIVVDNGGSDDTIGRLAQDFPDQPALTAIRSEQNLMFSAGNNLGFAHAQGEYAVFLNNDTVVTPGWLDALIEPFGYDATVGLTGPKLLYLDGLVQCCGLAFSERSKIPYHLYREHPGDAPEVNRARVFQALTGACLAIRGDDFAGIRGFDPVFINGCEDLDLAFRLRRYRQSRALYVPDSVVYHLESRTPGRGAQIPRNRAGFVTRWGDHVRPDDAVFYAEDGFEVVSYTRPGTETDGPKAIYLPTLKQSTAEPVPAPAVVNIGFVSIWHTRGVSILTKQLADAIEGDTVRTHIFARTESERFENAGPVWHPSVFNGGDDPTAESMLAWAREHDITSVVFVEVHPGDWKRAAALKAAGIKIICYEHLDILRVASLPRYAMFDDFLFASFTARDHLLRRFPDKRAILVPWATDLEIPEPAGVEVGDELRFVHVGGWGGINNRKNSDLVIRAFDAAAVPGATLELYTQVPIDKYGEDIAAICAANPQILVTEGTVDDIGQAYRDKDVLLWPSKREGVGLPIIEALASGLTVIISDGYLMKQWVVPGVHGLVCPARPRYGIRELPELEVDEAGLVDRIRELAGNPDLVRELRTAVVRDRWLWVWGWQKDALRDELVAMATRQHYRPSESLAYVPAEVLQFEADRLAAG